jgi:hypothetical protein
MPNHITTIIKASENVLNALLSEEDGTQCVDFSKIIPMPKILKDVQCEFHAVDIVEVLFDGLKIKDGGIFENIAYSNKINSLKDGAIKNWDDKRIENLINMIKAKKETGYTSWYEWSIDNWGTKWNAYDFVNHGDHVKFDTAWATPRPVIEKLSKMFPEESIEVKYADEDIGSNYGHFIIKDGEIIEIEIDDPIRFAVMLKYEEIPEYYRENQLLVSLNILMKMKMMRKIVSN